MEEGRGGVVGANWSTYSNQPEIDQGDAVTLRDALRKRIIDNSDALLIRRRCFIGYYWMGSKQGAKMRHGSDELDEDIEIERK